MPVFMFSIMQQVKLPIYMYLPVVMGDLLHNVPCGVFFHLAFDLEIFSGI